MGWSTRLLIQRRREREAEAKYVGPFDRAPLYHPLPADPFADDEQPEYPDCQAEQDAEDAMNPAFDLGAGDEMEVQAEEMGL